MYLDDSDEETNEVIFEIMAELLHKSDTDLLDIIENMLMGMTDEQVAAFHKQHVKSVN